MMIKLQYLLPTQKGVEYMITRKLYEKLDPEERSLWHSHEFEVSPFLSTTTELHA